MDPASKSDLPIASIGAGPVGLAAAAHAVRRGITPRIFERGLTIATALRSWAHVRVFTPWRYNVDAAARDLLLEQGWQEPDTDTFPTGADIVRDYLEPLARHPALAPHLRCHAEVGAIARAGLDKLTTAGRAQAPFQVLWRDADGREHRPAVRAVLDASGTWSQPNPLGVDGLMVPGERAALDPIVEAPLALAPLIDPDLHSCGTVPPHGARELAHPEPGFYIVGSKSYGRAPTFLMMTGYEQVRSVMAEIAGDHAAAQDVRFVLPETGVCSTAPRETEMACCGPTPAAAPAACRGARV